MGMYAIQLRARARRRRRLEAYNAHVVANYRAILARAATPEEVQKGRREFALRAAASTVHNKR